MTLSLHLRLCVSSLKIFRHTLALPRTQKKSIGVSINGIVTG